MYRITVYFNPGSALIFITGLPGINIQPDCIGDKLMNSLVSIILLGGRVVLASVIGLAIQLVLLVKKSEYLLDVQEGIKNFASGIFASLDVNPQYHVGYNLIGGDNIVVHTFFVLIAYVTILLLILPFRPRKPRRYSR